MIDLKPCPFCGNEAELKTVIRTNCFPTYQNAYVRCKSCKASTCSFEDKNLNGQHIFKAIEAWNRRCNHDRTGSKTDPA